MYVFCPVSSDLSRCHDGEEWDSWIFLFLMVIWEILICDKTKHLKVNIFNSCFEINFVVEAEAILKFSLQNVASRKLGLKPIPLYAAPAKHWSVFGIEFCKTASLLYTTEFLKKVYVKS